MGVGVMCVDREAVGVGGGIRVWGGFGRGVELGGWGSGSEIRIKESEYDVM